MAMLASHIFNDTISEPLKALARSTTQIYYFTTHYSTKTNKLNWHRLLCLLIMSIFNSLKLFTPMI